LLTAAPPIVAGPLDVPGSPNGATAPTGGAEATGCGSGFFFTAEVLCDDGLMAENVNAFLNKTRTKRSQT
jgi:hypothetical protein